jgi:hypothetical protein
MEERKKDIGRASKYKPEYDEKVYKLWQEGYLNGEMAKHFGVTLRTMQNWRKVHPSFNEQYELGRAVKGEAFVKLPEIDERYKRIREDYQYFKFMVTNIYKVGLASTEKLKGTESADQLLNMGLNLAISGEGTPYQVKSLLDGALTKVRIEERNEFEKRMQAMEAKLAIQGSDAV